MGLEVQSRVADRECSRLSSTAGQLHGDSPLSALSGRCRPSAPMIPTGRSTVDQPGYSAAYRTWKGWRPRRLLREWRLRHFKLQLAKVHCETRLLGTGGELRNVPEARDGWLELAAAPNVGGICIGCTMPGFPDKFMPFMDEPPGAKLSMHRDWCLWNGRIRSAALA